MFVNVSIYVLFKTSRWARRKIGYSFQNTCVQYEYPHFLDLATFIQFFLLHFYILFIRVLCSSLLKIKAVCYCIKHNKICHRLPISKEFNLRRWALLISPAEKWFVSFISDYVSSLCGSGFLLIHKNNQNHSHSSQYEKSNLSFLWLNEFTYPFLGDEVHLLMLSSNGLVT